MSETQGTHIWHDIAERAESGDDRDVLMAEVWNPTPWIIDAYTGPPFPDDIRERGIAEWCYTRYGQQSLPIHSRSGSWRQGSVTIHGWTWMGFATELMMNEFQEQWPNPSGR